jgi:hypothetical protein
MWTPSEDLENHNVKSGMRSRPIHDVVDSARYGASVAAFVTATIVQAETGASRCHARRRHPRASRFLGVS